MIGRTPSNIETIRFLNRGSIVDEVCAQYVLRYFLKKIGTGGVFGAGRAIVTVQTRGAETHRRAIKNLLSSIGLTRTSLIERPLAAALGINANISGAAPLLIIDIGADSTDAAIYGAGCAVVSRTIAIAGADFDAAIAKYLRSEHNLQINPGTLDQIKAALIERGPGQQLEVVGRDLRQGVPRRIIFGYDEMVKTAASVVRKIAENVRDVVEAAPQDVRQNLRAGTLVGGGSLMPTLPEAITLATGIHVEVAEDPIAAGIDGCGRLVAEKGLDVFWSARGDELI